MAKPVKDARKARRQQERSEKKQKKQMRQVAHKAPAKRRHEDAHPKRRHEEAPVAKRPKAGNFHNKFMEMIQAQAAEGAISLDSAKVLKKPQSKTEISEEDIALKRLEKSLGLTKTTGKAKLNKEFEKDGLGADFGDFLMGLDDLSARITGKKPTPTADDDADSISDEGDASMDEDEAMDDDEDDDEEDDYEGMDEETRREMELLAEEDAAFLQEMDQLPTDDEEDDDDDLAQFESDLSEDEGDDEVAANTARNQHHSARDDDEDVDSDEADKLDEEVEDDEDSQEDTKEDSEDEAKSEDDAEKTPVVVEEDIYGRPKVAAPAVSATRYVPPHLRRAATTDEQQLREARRRINGQLNRLSESNMEPICMEFESIYRSFVRADVNAILLEALLALCCHETQVMTQLINISGALLGALFHSVGTEIVGFFVEHFVQKFEQAVVTLRASSSDDEDGETRSKEATNLLLMITTLYMFDTVHCGMIYDIFRFLVDSFTGVDIELIHALLQACGPSLRADDASALTDMIATVQTKASQHEEQRVRFLLDLIYNLKKATKKTKSSAFSNDRVQQLRKWIGRVKTRVGHANNALRVSFSELLHADAQGRWWIIGGTWVPPSHAASAAGDKDAQQNALLKLAEKQRMNTDVRRSIFCAIMGASDCIEAYEGVLKLGLKDKQEREIIRYNPYYALLAEKFATADPRYKFTLQLAYWDVFKQLDEWKPRKVYNMACLLAKLLETGAMTLAVLKVLDFTDLSDATVLFLRVAFERILSIADDSALIGVFERIAQQKSKMEATRDGVAVFFHQHLLPALKTLEAKKKAKMVTRMLDAMGKH